MDYGIFNVRTDVNACHCTRGCTDTVKESALKVHCGRKIPCRTGESNQPWQRTGPMLYQLSYIPTCVTVVSTTRVNVPPHLCLCTVCVDVVSTTELTSPHTNVSVIGAANAVSTLRVNLSTHNVSVKIGTV